MLSHKSKALDNRSLAASVLQLGLFYLLINDLISLFVIISQKYALDSKEVSFYLSSEF